ncbi:ceramide synthase 1 [Anaeramoeba flamelloides]|uniref:Ceramide synthase n=1 Tax=Anaeramoeba flamelloides TaxID=1746091 RepID=A0AAV7ZIQ2_9EUKA|nr:ceramide synthase [Anaeramoeba flamelloides]KAJ6248075.1 ceramide synthase 1 [Anaeramoeba flamelloides]
MDYDKFLDLVLFHKREDGNYDFGIQDTITMGMMIVVVLILRFLTYKFIYLPNKKKKKNLKRKVIYTSFLMINYPICWLIGQIALYKTDLYQMTHSAYKGTTLWYENVNRESFILESSNYFNFPVLVEYTIKGIFGVLYLLQIYWTICVIKVAINFVKSGGIRDIRSDYDPNGTDRGENQEKEKEKEIAEKEKTEEKRKDK